MHRVQIPCDCIACGYHANWDAGCFNKWTFGWSVLYGHRAAQHGTNIIWIQMMIVQLNILCISFNSNSSKALTWASIAKYGCTCQNCVQAGPLLEPRNFGGHPNPPSAPIPRAHPWPPGGGRRQREWHAGPVCQSLLEWIWGRLKFRCYCWSRSRKTRPIKVGGGPKSKIGSLIWALLLDMLLAFSIFLFFNKNIL